MTRAGGFGLPGIGAITSNTEKDLLWGGDAATNQVITMNGVLDSAAADAQHTGFTETLRAGMILGKVTSTGEFKEWNADILVASLDGSEQIAGVLGQEQRTTDFNGTAGDRLIPIYMRAPFVASQLLIQGTAMTSHADEFLARRILVQNGSIFDDDPMGYLAGTPRQVQQDGDVTIVEADNNKVYICTNADCQATLPTIKPGLAFEFIMAENFELNITGSANLLIGNDLTADALIWSTTGEQIGMHFRVESIYVDTTLHWMTHILKVPFSTDDYLTLDTITT